MRPKISSAWSGSSTNSLRAASFCSWGIAAMSCTRTREVATSIGQHADGAGDSRKHERVQQASHLRMRSARTLAMKDSGFGMLPFSSAMRM